MSAEIEHLVKARLWVARLGETDLYGWWGSDGVLGEDGGFVGPRVLPLTHGTGRARVSTAVARFACDERHPDRSARHLFRLDAAIEEQVDGFLSERLGDLTYWNDLLAKLEAVAHGADIAATLRDAGSAREPDLTYARSREIGPGGRSVIVEPGAALSETVSRLAAAFVLSRPGELVVPYLQVGASA